MKRFLLCAVATVIVGAVSAQPFANKGMKSNPKTAAVKSMQHQIEIANAPVVKSNAAISKKRATTLNKKLVQSNVAVKAAKSFQLMSSRRAAEVQAQYTGTGVVTGLGTSPWTMLSGTSEDGKTLLLADVIPNPYPTSLDNVVVEYTLVNNKITIPTQKVFSSDEWKAIIFSASSEDGSITMELGEDGSLTLPQGEQIIYGAFTGDKFDPTLETYLGYLEIVKNINYALSGQVIAPVVEYNPTGLYLHFNISRSAYSYNNGIAMIPAYTPLDLVNGTVDLADRWEWSLDEIDNQGELSGSQKGTERDFTAQIETGEYSAAQLIGYNKDAASMPFVLGAVHDTEAAYLIAGTTLSNWDMSDGTFPMATLANLDNSIARYTSLSTPDVNKVRQVSSFVLYQGEPSAPLYMEGINMFVGNMSIKDPANFTLKCKIQKATRDDDGWISLGDVIAQADLTADKVLVGYAGEGSTITELIWDEMYVEDEFGLSEPISFLNIDEEFAIVIEGWDNGTFSCDYTWGEYDCNMSAPYRTFFFRSGDEQIDKNMYRLSDGCCQLVGFVGASYGYLHTTDNTDLVIPAEGGKAAVHVEPMFYANDDEGNPTTGLWLADDSDEVDWLQIDITNEVYSSEEFGFDLAFAADALPEGVTGRKAHLVFEQWGGKLEINVTQGEATGISVTVKKVENNTPAYNLAGQRVNSGYKGLVIKNGRKFMNK